MNENTDNELQSCLSAPPETLAAAFARRGCSPLNRCACGKVISQNKAQCLNCATDAALERLDKKLSKICE